jgi:hypothetical protein
MGRTHSTTLTLVGLVLLTGCSDPIKPSIEVQPQLAAANACWGQATRVFALMGGMGAHASEQPTPRLGLANLARALYDAGVIDEPTMQALGVFVAAELGLSIEACLT